MSRRGCEARPSMTLPGASPQPARRLGRILAEQRADGKEFNAAWPAAVAGATAGLERRRALGVGAGLRRDAAGVGGLLASPRAGAAPCHPGRLNCGNRRFAGIRLRLIERWSWDPTPTLFSRRRDLRPPHVDVVRIDWRLVRWFRAQAAAGDMTLSGAFMDRGLRARRVSDWPCALLRQRCGGCQRRQEDRRATA